MTIQGVSFCSSTPIKTDSVKNQQGVVTPPVKEVNDEFVKSQDNSPKELTKEDKQKIIKSANANAAGWAILGGPISTLYYHLRSDKTIADKYNLDVEKDKEFIKEIRKSQVGWTLPSLLNGTGYGALPGLAAWGYNTFRNSDNINVES